MLITALVNFDDEFRGRAGGVFGVSQTCYGVFLSISLAYIHVDYDQNNLIYLRCAIVSETVQ